MELPFVLIITTCNLSTCIFIFLLHVAAILGSCKTHVSITTSCVSFCISVQKDTLLRSQYYRTSSHKCAFASTVTKNISAVATSRCLSRLIHKNSLCCVYIYILFLLYNYNYEGIKSGQPVTQRDSRLHNGTAGYTTGQPVTQPDSRLQPVTQRDSRLCNRTAII